MMVKFISASEAARRIGVTDKTVRSWIAQGKVDAHHVSKNRLAIAETDVERLARERRLYMSSPLPDVTELAARVEHLEQKLAELSEQYRALEARIRNQEPREPAYVSQLGITYTEPTETHARRAYTPRSSERDLPPGAVLAVHFAEQHGVNRRTFSDHLRKGIHGEKLEISSKPNPSRPGEVIRYVSQEDVPRVLDYWRRHNVTFTE